VCGARWARATLGWESVNLDQYTVADCFDLDRLVRSAVLVAAVVLDDDRKIVLPHLVCQFCLAGQFRKLPLQVKRRFCNCWTTQVVCLSRRGATAGVANHFNMLRQSI
jgi:hypothetical protein